MTRIAQQPPLPTTGTLMAVAAWALDAFRKVFYGLWQAQEQCWEVEGFPGQTAAITTGLGKTFFAPWALKLHDLAIGLVVPQTSGSIFTVDIKVNGTTILATKLTIDNTEYTSATGTAFAFASTNTQINKFDRVSIHVDQVGDGTAKGLEVLFYGVRM